MTCWRRAGRAGGAGGARPRKRPRLARQLDLVIKTAALAQRHIGHLCVNGLDGFFVPGVMGLIQHGIKQDAGLDIIQVCMVIAEDLAVGAKHRVQPGLGIVKVPCIAGQLPGLEHPGKKDPLVVVEVSLGGQVRRGIFADHG